MAKSAGKSATAPRESAAHWKPVCAIVIGLALTIGASRLARHIAAQELGGVAPTHLAADVEP